MKKRKVGIIDYGMGNLKSIENALDYLGVKNQLVDNSKYLSNYTHLILPGVGSFKKAIKNLKSSGMFSKIIKISKTDKKILGICLGMQLLFSDSTEEGYSKGLGIIKGNVEKFSFKETKKLKIPHVGFNRILFEKNCSFFQDLKKDCDFYFDHSYRITKFDESIIHSKSKYGISFLSAFNIKNIFGTQFHPEKSQSNGLLLLRNFLKT